MAGAGIHEIIVTREHYDILSADTEFYSFMGERFYFTFDRLIVEEDRELFSQQIAKCSGDSFFMRLLDLDEHDVYFCASVHEGSTKKNVLIRLISTENLFETRQQLKQQIYIRNALLELYCDRYFEYMPVDENIRFYSVQKSEQDIEIGTLDEYEQYLLEHASEEYKPDIREFIKNMRLGKRQFEIRVGENLINQDERIVSTSMKAAAIYRAGKLYMVTGYLHLGMRQGHNANKRVEMDSLTGLLPKGEITNTAIQLINVKKTKDITIAIVDVDYFKKVNDTFGHLCGDEILKRVAEILENEVGDNGVVGRIGGDEFMIIFYHADDMENMRERLRSIKNIVYATFPPNDEGKPSVSLSIGCAAYPKDADCYQDVFMLADFALYIAKEKGRNRYVIFDKAKHGTIEEVRNCKKTPDNRIDGRGNMSKGDILCVMMDMVYAKEPYQLEKLLDDFIMNFNIHRIIIYAGEPYQIRYMAGNQILSQEQVTEESDYVNDEEFQKLFDEDGMNIFSEIKYLEDKQEKVYRKIVAQNIESFVQIKFLDKNGIPAILSLEAVNQRITWNQSFIPYFRLFARILSEYEMV